MSALSALAQAGIDERSLGGEPLQLAERPEVTVVRVHSLLDLPAELPALADWPARTGGCRAGDPAVFCLRPREWLCLSESKDPSEIHDRFLADVDPATTAVHDQSDGLAVFRLGGAAAPWLLAKLCGLDMAGAASQRPHCARTRMGDAAVVLLFCGDAAGGFDLLVDRSLAPYLWTMLTASVAHAVELARLGRSLA